MLQTHKRVILIHVELLKSTELVQDLCEFRELAIAAGLKIAAVIACKRESPEPKYFLGSGKVKEVYECVLANSANLVIFNHFLSPVQERNLQQLLQCQVLDRTGLILAIFAQRARSFAGKLQVELAQLEHLATRLVRGWTHLERQRGGIGLRGGPGETQLETDRRILQQKTVYLKKRLTKLTKQRMQNRRARKRSFLSTIALVGYTNAGKSTLFNLLTTAKVYVANKLFATLDPTLRRIDLPGFGAAVIVDTVGFIRDLPHELIEAFHATLEETREADLLLHVVDASDPQKNAKIEIVNKTLAEIDASHIPQLQVLNKIDLLEGFEPRVDKDMDSFPKRIWLSATNGDGIELLLQSIKQVVFPPLEEIELGLLPHACNIRAMFYQNNAVVSEEIDGLGNFHLKLCIRLRDLAQIFA